ncbi:MAG: polymer-forming cytoskeletal protein [Deltaproteobacteria bacterium]|nr:polymer-forming cytoskeletal protein [Deltaproteobacteria bacterium]
MADTIIGTKTRVEGTVEGSDRLVVCGEVRGTVAMDGAVLVERSGKVEAEVAAAEVAIAGTITGRVTGTTRVEILPAARMIGDVRTARILISDGAVFKGRVDMDLGDGEG